jgi:hypothetical protein
VFSLIAGYFVLKRKETKGNYPVQHLGLWEAQKRPPPKSDRPQRRTIFHHSVFCCPTLPAHILHCRYA